tara:strand:- start:523 stop:1359 length:837 start_codon:yes stop_codon:yes gene_type:complete
MSKLTIGLCVYDDYDGAYFTLQSLRLHHSEVADRLEFIIINNKPDSQQGKALSNLTKWIKQPITYVEFTKYKSPFLKGKIFDIADTEYVLVMDCHVLIDSGAIKKLLDYYDEGKDKGNLLQGPLLYDDLTSISTHFDLSKWGSHMWGQWATDDRGQNKNAPPFEIPAQGMGLFSCRKDSWLGFNNKFRGFGGEEGYIHTKYKNHQKKTMCLPFLRWVHRFERPGGIPFNPTIEDKFRNYMIGFQEIGKDTEEVVEQFKGAVSDNYIQRVKEEIVKFNN